MVVKRWRKLHKWIGLIIGIQVLLWISGGVVMSAIPIDIVRGNHLVERLKMKPQGHQLGDRAFLFDLREWQSTRWVDRAGQWVLEVRDHKGDTFYLDGNSGVPLGELSPSIIKTLAQKQYLGQGYATSVQKLAVPPQEVGHLKGAIYRVHFNDMINTDFYLDANTGEVKSVRSDIWRFYDFFWMLHIMDYEHSKNFNNPLIIVAALLALLFTVSGFVLLYFNLVRPVTIKMLRRTALNKS